MEATQKNPLERHSLGGQENRSAEWTADSFSQGADKSNGNAMLTRVLDCLDRGYPVIPLCWPDAQGQCACPKKHTNLKEIGKAPLLGKGYQERILTREEVEDWWRRYPHANYGIQLKPAELFVLDADSLEADREMETLGVTPGPRVRRGDHIHRYFKNDTGVCGVAIRQGTSGKVDILAHGYVVGPGSLHRSGIRYLEEVTFNEIAMDGPPRWATTLLLESLKKRGDTAGFADDLPPVDLEALQIPHWLHDVIVHGQPTHGEQYPSRSEACWAVVTALVQAGHDTATIASILLDPRFAISAKPREQGARWVAGEIGRARAKVDTGEGASSSRNETNNTRGTGAGEQAEPEQEDTGEAEESAKTPRSARPAIRITTNITAVVNEAEHALLALPHGPHLFQRIDQLCFISHSKRAPQWLVRESGAPTIVACSPAQLRERMSRAADWFKWVARTEAWMPALPPDWAVETLHGRRDWDFPVLTDVVSSPTLREDGEILSAPGYDPDTGLFLDTQGVIFPPIPAQPTIDDAVRAVAALTEPLCDFPFAGEHGKSAILAATCSLVARHAIRGCVPLFAVDSTTRGTGKGLLIDVPSTTATGRLAPRWAQARDGEEDRKALLTIGLEGDSCCHIDNLTRPLGSGALDSALTAGVIKGRLLGLNKTVEAPMNCVFFASGNNMSFVGDTARRVVPIHLESLEEHPENRDDFTHKRLLEWVRQERPRLVVEALTLLRAYFVAGCPKQGIPAYGSFEAWSDLVRSALIWAGCADPCEGRKTLEAESDPGYENLTRLLHCWAACYDSKAVTLSSVIGDVGQRKAETIPNEWNELGEALSAFDPRFDGKRWDVKRIGLGLRAIKGRVVGGKRLIQVGQAHKGVVLWALQQV